MKTHLCITPYIQNSIMFRLEFSRDIDIAAIALVEFIEQDLEGKEIIHHTAEGPRPDELVKAIQRSRLLVRLQAPTYTCTYFAKTTINGIEKPIFSNACGFQPSVFFTLGSLPPDMLRLEAK